MIGIIRIQAADEILYRSQLPRQSIMYRNRFIPAINNDPTYADACYMDNLHLPICSNRPRREVSGQERRDRAANYAPCTELRKPIVLFGKKARNEHIGQRCQKDGLAVEETKETTGVVN